MCIADVHLFPLTGMAGKDNQDYILYWHCYSPNIFSWLAKLWIYRCHHLSDWVVTFIVPRLIILFQCWGRVLDMVNYNTTSAGCGERHKIRRHVTTHRFILNTELASDSHEDILEYFVNHCFVWLYLSVCRSQHLDVIRGILWFR